MQVLPTVLRIGARLPVGASFLLSLVGMPQAC